MNDNCDISFIIPAYNAEAFVPRCLETLLARRTPRFEVIVVDDGSTDATGELVDCWAARDERVVVVHTPNRGPGLARNVGMERARGTYLFFADADDCVLWDGVELLLERARSSGCQIVGGSYVHCSGDAVRWERAGVPEGAYGRAGTAEERRLFHLIKTRSVFGYCHNKLYLRSFVASSGVAFGAHRFMEDQLFNCMLFADNPRALYVRVPAYARTVRGGLAARCLDPFIGEKLALLLAEYDAFLRGRGLSDENQDLFVPLALRLYAWAGFCALERPGATRGDVLVQLRTLLEQPCMGDLLADPARRLQLDTVCSLPQRAFFKLLFDTAAWGDGLFHADLFHLAAPAMRAYVRAAVA